MTTRNPLVRIDGKIVELPAADNLGGSAIPPSQLTTKGDLLTYDSAVNRLPVGSNNQVLTADSTQSTGIKWSTLQVPSIVVAVTYAATTTVDLASYSGYVIVILDLTLTGDVTFNLTNGTDGQIIRLRVRQDATGSRIWTSGANLRFSTDITAITLSTAASKLDYIAFEWNGTDSKADVLATNFGF